MARRSSFWRNFWGETGRNSGKWMSNKVFGDEGWATPKRVILRSEGSGKSDKDDDFLDEGDELPSVKTKLDKKYLYLKATELKFDSNDIAEISTSLDELLLGARQALQDQSSVDIFKVKIRSGITRLKRLGEIDLADFYSSELKRLNRSVILKKISIFILAIIVFSGLIFVAFFYKPF